MDLAAVTTMRMSRLAGSLILAGAFGLGLFIGSGLKPSLLSRLSGPVTPARATLIAATSHPDRPIANGFDQGIVYPAEVLRVIDGDTFEARVRVWPGLDVDTKVRLRGIDAAELHARCADELAKAQTARTQLANILAEGGITVSRIGVDKYGGRVDAAIATRNTADVSAAMLAGGFARTYDGGKRGSWCG